MLSSQHSNVCTNVESKLQSYSIGQVVLNLMDTLMDDAEYFIHCAAKKS